MPGKPRYTVAQVERALRDNCGIMSAAAAELDCSPQTIRNYVDRNPALAGIASEIVDKNLDVAEHKLLSAIRAGNLTAVIFYLKCKGKLRGYSERHELTGPDGAALQVDVTKLTDDELQRIASGGPALAGRGGAGAAS